MITVAFTKDEIFRLVSQDTIYLSDPVGEKNNLVAQRISEVIPMLKDDQDFFSIKLYEAGSRIFRIVGYNVTGIDFPFLVTDSTYPVDEFPSSIVFRFNLYDGANEYVVMPMVQQHIAEALIRYIVAEWLLTKGYGDMAALKMKQFEFSLQEIKSSLMYGQRATKTYRTL